MKRIGSAVILAFAVNAHAEGMGRLFFTPEQRLILDNARGQKVKIEEQSEERAPEIVSLNGVVKRNDGHTTVWLNNRAISDRRTSGGVTIHPQGTASDPVLFTIPQVDRAVSLRVGQDLDVTTGQVVEPYSTKAAEMKRTLAAQQESPGKERRPEDRTEPQQFRPESSTNTTSSSKTGAAPSSAQALSAPAAAQASSPASLAKPAP
jgi:hypothetical protein